MGNRLGTINSFTLTGSSQSTTAFGSQTYRVRLATEAEPAYFSNPAASPTAGSTTSNVIGAHRIDYVDVAPGQKIAVLQATTGGKITITELE